jgi:hypothetical protein
MIGTAFLAVGFWHLNKKLKKWIPY